MRNAVLLLTLHVLPVLITNSKNSDHNKIKGFQKHNSRSGLPTLKPSSSTENTVPLKTENSSPSFFSPPFTEKSLTSKQDRNHRTPKATDLEVDARPTHSGTTSKQPSPAFAGGPNFFYKLPSGAVRLPRNAPWKPKLPTQVALIPKKKLDKHVPSKKPKATRKPAIRKTKSSHKPTKPKKTNLPANTAKHRRTKPPPKPTKPKKTRSPHTPGVKTTSPERTVPLRIKPSPKPTKAVPSKLPLPIPPSASTSSRSSVQVTDSFSNESMPLPTTHDLDATMEGDIYFGGVRRKPQRGNKSQRKAGTLIVIILIAAGILVLLVAVAAVCTVALYLRHRKKKKRSNKRGIVSKRPRRMESADIYATKFAHGGPLVLDAKLKGPVQHASEFQSKSQSLQSLKFDPHLNEIVDIGSNVEVVDINDGTTTAKSTGTITAEEPKCEKGKSVSKSPMQLSGRKKANRDRTGVTPKDASPLPVEKTAKGTPPDVKSYSLARHH